MTLDKERSRMLRGLAILGIILHNFLHLARYGFSVENEFGFSFERTAQFFKALSSGGFLSATGHILSFLGWTGVPVFVFLSAYGLTKKHEGQDSKFVLRPYVQHSWKKLFMLMWPGILIYIIMHFGEWGFALRSLSSLTLLANFFLPFFIFEPEIYWYFGLTFELYLLYIAYFYVRDKRFLVVTAVFTWVLQSLLLLTGSPSHLVHWNLANFVGWLPVFSLGVYCARSDKTVSFSLPVDILVAVASLGLIVLCNLNKYLWVFIHIPSLVFFFSLMRLIARTSLTKRVFLYLGNLSAFIFACHPVSRSFVNRFLPVGMNVWIKLLVFLALTLVLAMGFQYAFKKLAERRTPEQLPRK